MGRIYHFVCEDCNYETHVSGGDDAGMRTLTTTISCRECGELFDVAISQHPFTEPFTEPACPHSEHGDQSHDNATDHSPPRHHVERWTAPGPCPKCGKTMAYGETVTLWD